MIEKGSNIVWYYLDKNGTPLYDVYLSNEGKKTNKDGMPIQCLYKKSEDLLIELQIKLDDLTAKEALIQGNLF